LKRFLTICAVGLFGCVLLAAFLAAQNGQDPTGISLIQLISKPDRYDGKVVRLEGFLRLEFEGNALYLHQEDDDHMLTKNAIWVDASADMIKRRNDLNKKYVLLEGTFDAKDHGHMGLFSGSLHKVKRADVFASRTDLEKQTKHSGAAK
jgi:hypothetical protein